MDAEMDGFAAGLSNCLTKDGQTTPTADIPMGGKKIKGLANGTASGDAVHYGQVATTDTNGVVQFATDAEVQAGSANNVAVTPSNLKVATTTVRGMVVQADATQAKAGAASDLVVSPAILKAAVPEWVTGGVSGTGSAHAIALPTGCAFVNIELYGVVPTLNNDWIGFRFYTGGADVSPTGWVSASHGIKTNSLEDTSVGPTDRANLMWEVSSGYHGTAKISIPRPDVGVGKVVLYEAGWLRADGLTEHWSGAMRFPDGRAFSHCVIFSINGQPITLEGVVTGRRYP